MKFHELFEAIKPLVVDVTKQYIEDKKSYTQVYPHIQGGLRRFVEFKANNPTRPLSKKDYRLHGELAQYSHIHLGGDLYLIYSINSGILLLIAIATHDEIKPRQQKQLRTRLDNIVRLPRPQDPQETK